MRVQEDDRLRQHLAEAVARCSGYGHNRQTFGKEGAVAPLVKYLKSKNRAVHKSTARALFELSKDPDNCIAMHETGVVAALLGTYLLPAACCLLPATCYLASYSTSTLLPFMDYRSSLLIYRSSIIDGLFIMYQGW